MQKGEETKEKIIEVSLELFHSKGYYNTSVNDIMKKAGIKKGGLYFHIQSKEKLAIRVLEDALSTYESLIADGLENLPPLEQIKKKVESIVEYHVNVGLHKGCLFGNMALEIGTKDSEISLFLKDVFKRWENSFEEMIIKSVESGELRLLETPNEFAKMILAVIEGGVMMSKISGDVVSLKKCGGYILDLIDERGIKGKTDEAEGL